MKSCGRMRICPSRKAGLWRTLRRRVRSRRNCCQRGNTACKIDPFTPLFPGPRDIGLPEMTQAAKIWKAIRDAVGNELEVGIGTHGQLTTYSAIRVADFLEGVSPVLVRGAGAAGEHRGDGASCGAYVDTDRDG